ncbi:hypothetical protein [Candidatus Nitrosocosmicus sp. SS]|uniref:hypothetical protein n=1 Tax=Candidatus Nitrosocosmicus agrestis TaxID=2563600 RepID=UPI00122E4B40|nr:hypothetical protein [Candidatus Nitrosocosmicus sp. SS]KAA2280436.1 hypothetical protein F1Z66_10570 [Candidatus Nitrosocosmicus sp. SS]KAF0869214.1 hypothetical protein E5N71_05775 [Candidatus Nitrosocosmicus sp. SS]HET8794222.1 hypothetical protein [Nitrososphaeraceae archaeon]
MPCKGICHRHKAIKRGNTSSRYSEGQKRCQRCEIYITWNISVFCPCCGTRLRYKPRNGKLKLKYNKIKDEEKKQVLIR